MQHNVLVRPNSSESVLISIGSKNPYQIVEEIRKSNLQAQKKTESSFDSQKLADILPIHNSSGIRDLFQIERMKASVRKGEEILEADGLPNIKLILAPNNKLLQFDGTHSLLAYFLEGRKLLREVPYLVIAADGITPVSVDELVYFFPKSSREEVKTDWEKYVVNWQAQVGKQLEIRQANSIGELAREFSKANKSSVEK